MKNKLHGSIIVTYRCNAQCNMCDVWKSPSMQGEEISFDVIEKLPEMFFTNVTGGEPFVRQDFPDVVISIGVIHHLPDPEKGFRTLYSLLKPGGEIFIWVYGYSSIIPVIKLLRGFTRGKSERVNRIMAIPFAVIL